MALDFNAEIGNFTKADEIVDISIDEFDEDEDKDEDKDKRPGPGPDKLGF